MDSSAEPTKDLVDVTGTPLGALMTATGNPALAEATARIVDEVVGVDFSVQIQDDADDGWKGSDDNGR